MTDKAKEPQEGLSESAHKIWLAGLGAVALAQETGGKALAELVERGRKLEAESKLSPSEVTEPLRKAAERAKDAVQHLGKGLDDQVTAALRRIGVPTREEIAELGRRVDQLTESIEKLKTNRT